MEVIGYVPNHTGVVHSAQTEVYALQKGWLQSHYLLASGCGHGKMTKG